MRSFLTKKNAKYTIGMEKKASRLLRDMKMMYSPPPFKLSPLKCFEAQTKFSGSSLALLPLTIFSTWRFKPWVASAILPPVKTLLQGVTEDEIRTSSTQMLSRIRFLTGSSLTSLISCSTTDSLTTKAVQETEGEVVAGTTVEALKVAVGTTFQHITILLEALEGCSTVLRIWRDIWWQRCIEFLGDINGRSTQ